jgi:hypothetical protein
MLRNCDIPPTRLSVHQYMGATKHGRMLVLFANRTVWHILLSDLATCSVAEGV